MKYSLLKVGMCVFIFSACNNNRSEKAPVPASVADTVLTVEKHDTAVKSETIIPPDSTVKTKTVNTIAATDTAAIDSTKKYVFLTFDDGPQPGTMNVYHNLKALGLKGTFFMVGLHATYGKAMHDAVDTIRNAYPEILLANHSYTHARDKYIAFYHHVRSCFDDFMQAQASLDVQKKFIRLPGNSAWVLATGMQAHPLVKPVCELLDSAGYNVIGWDTEWNFKRDPSGHGSVPVQTPETMVRMVENALNNHHTHRRNAVVLLSHDRMFNRPNYSDSLYKFMRLLKTRNPGYVFETVEHYPGAKQ
ncbi:hypothetical protein A9P82_09775 [Arachidicoccus ginsenosidimutans]|uniref:polysaccharide deacetylase family protein n=1 Tax=Arachidicoccus sp. BS20 TaxID=1850526 RepID=UPI0007F04C93|nr:polysaccharide deacetylase family protein [Arachidicoccus sp. BS20]ANI89554.1 hypothetical protein A9P82_09775 [Arachidicoccus sp. BS20]